MDPFLMSRVEMTIDLLMSRMSGELFNKDLVQVIQMLFNGRNFIWNRAHSETLHHSMAELARHISKSIVQWKGNSALGIGMNLKEFWL